MERFKSSGKFRHPGRLRPCAWGGAAVVVAGMIRLLGAPPEPPAFSPVQPAPADVPAEWKKGYELARVYCQACHLFPEPELLDKKHWPGALRLMAPLLGVASFDFSRRSDGSLLKQSGLFPEQPFISADDWRAVVEYYYHFAPAAPLPQKNPPAIRRGFNQFRPRLLSYPGSAPATSLVKVDPGRHRIYIGNAAARSLDVCSPSGDLVSRLRLDSPPSCLTLRNDGFYLTLVGHIYPSDLREGKLLMVKELGSSFEIQTLLTNLPRPVHVEPVH